MLKFEHEGKQYRLKFFHDRESTVNGKMHNNMFVASRGGLTTAEVDVLTSEGQWQTEFVGTAFCHPQDNFCKETGRRVALEDLFRLNLDLTKSLKRAINTAYWNRT